MNPAKLSVRMDRETGALFLTEEKYRKPIKKITDLTAPILLALCADVTAEDGTTEVSRDVRFGNDMAFRITVAVIDPSEAQT